MFICAWFDCNYINTKLSLFVRTLTYCVWNLMVGEDQPEVKQERVALPPPVKRRDLHMRMS